MSLLLLFFCFYSAQYLQKFDQEEKDYLLLLCESSWNHVQFQATGRHAFCYTFVTVLPGILVWKSQPQKLKTSDLKKFADFIFMTLFEADAVLAVCKSGDDLWPHSVPYMLYYWCHTRHTVCHTCFTTDDVAHSVPYMHHYWWHSTVCCTCFATDDMCHTVCHTRFTADDVALSVPYMENYWWRSTVCRTCFTTDGMFYAVCHTCITTDDVPHSVPYMFHYWWHLPHSVPYTLNCRWRALQCAILV